MVRYGLIRVNRKYVHVDVVERLHCGFRRSGPPPPAGGSSPGFANRTISSLPAQKRGTPSRDTHAPFLLSHVTFAASCVSCYAKDPFQELMMNTSVIRDDVRTFDVVILGGGYAGLMAALRLGRKKQTLRIALINASDQFLRARQAAREHRLRSRAAHPVDLRASCRHQGRVHLRPNRIP